MLVHLNNTHAYAETIKKQKLKPVLDNLYRTNVEVKHTLSTIQFLGIREVPELPKKGTLEKTLLEVIRLSRFIIAAVIPEIKNENNNYNYKINTKIIIKKKKKK